MCTHSDTKKITLLSYTFLQFNMFFKYILRPILNCSNERLFLAQILKKKSGGAFVLKYKPEINMM